MAWENIPRTHSFSLGDFHDFDRCVFRFFVNHHLGKKYELAEGSASQALGSLLDLAIKKVHAAKLYNQPPEYLINLIRAAEVQMKEEVASRGLNSFYGAQVPFLNPEVIQKANRVFVQYHQGIKGQYKKMIPTQVLSGPKPFWKLIIDGKLQLWGGPDSIEIGDDGIPEIVDYKYLEKGDESTEYLDMDLMPKLYTLLCADELQEMGFTKARFLVRLWHDPGNNSFYEEFELSTIENIQFFVKDKIERILRSDELQFCNKPYCKVCQHQNRNEWIKELQCLGWIKTEVPVSVSSIEVSPDLPF